MLFRSLKESTLERIVNWCANTQKIRYWDLLKKTIGMLPYGMDESSFGMGGMVYLYNPGNFPGMDELKEMSEEDKTSIDPERTLFAAFDLVIDGQTYIIPGASVPATDWDTFEKH